MNDEEEQCAKALEMCPNVEVWIRNIERQPDFSFWLPTSQDKFYPDFVARLTDGRILVVEYKGEHLVTGDDSGEKRMLGELWSSRSGGKCIFLMTTKRDEFGRDIYDQINHVVS